jgi:type IV pilus assembly protein PilO
MTRNFEWAKIDKIREPRVAMRVLIGVLVAANLAAAVMAFRPFGGSADDLRRRASSLQDQLAAAQARVAITRRLVDKVEGARRDGDRFLTQYVVDRRKASSALNEELFRMAREAGVKPGQIANEYEAIEGSDTLQMVNIQVAFEGQYQGLTKLVDLIDKSPRFLMIESLQTAAPLGNSGLMGVQLKIHTFVRGALEDAP